MTRTLPSLVLAGSPVERGEAHGEQARELVREAADRWRERVLDTAPLPAADYLRALVENSGFRAIAEEWTPELLGEMSGIARASGVDERVVFGMNLLDEEWWLRAEITGARAEYSHHCTSFARRPDSSHATLVAQNMDLSAWFDGLQVLLDVRPDVGPRVLAPSQAGMIALDALNEHGVGITVNTLAQLPTSSHGLPVAFAIRLAAGQRDGDAAARTVRALPHASGLNFLIGDPRGVTDLECGAGTVVGYAPAGPIVAHSNHPLATPSSSWAVAAAEVADLDHQGFSALRHDTARARLAERPHTVETFAALLAEPPLLRGTGEDRGFSFYGVVMECSETPVLHMTAGPPDGHPFTAHAVSSLAGANR